jgi:hypothetical protein
MHGNSLPRNYFVGPPGAGKTMLISDYKYFATNDFTRSSRTTKKYIVWRAVKSWLDESKTV